jgi:hypothetical protein
MKTAEQLAHEYWDRPQPQRGLIPFIKEVQLEAFKAGMERAAETAYQPGHSGMRSDRRSHEVREEILAAAQQLTQLP